MKEYSRGFESTWLWMTQRYKPKPKYGDYDGRNLLS